MDSLGYCYCALTITTVYLFGLFMQKRYRLFLPSVTQTFVWVATTALIICQLNGWGVSKIAQDNTFNLSSRFIFILMIASTLGFVIAHVATSNSETERSVELLDVNIVNNALIKFRWIPILCGVIGVLLFIFIITTIGNFNTFSDYRVLAISVKRVGYAEMLQRISGHINILGTFYLMLLGYLYGQIGIKTKRLLFTILLCSLINIGIGGRLWIINSTLPFFSTFVFSRKYSDVELDIKHRDKKHVFIIMALFISLFSVIGLFRNEDTDANFIDKFLYLTDGSRMTNMVLNQYPEGTYNYEWGTSTLAQPYVKSAMAQAFSQSIAYDIGLSVTVKSFMPSLYYDFGIWGGALFWCIVCFCIEYVYIKFKYVNSIFGILLMGQLSIMLFQTPIWNVFSTFMPAFIWLIIIYLFKDKLFVKTEIQN